MSSERVPEQVTAWKLFRVWALLGAQSFGGGSATLAMIRQAMVDRTGWVTEEEFNRYWAICQPAPGINLIGLAIVIGKSLAGASGSGACVAGMLLPSASITIALTAGYAVIRDLQLVRSALRGIVPATVGIGLVTAWVMARKPLELARREGRGRHVLAGLMLVGSAFAFVRWHPPVILVLVGAGLLGAVTARPVGGSGSK